MAQGSPVVSTNSNPDAIVGAWVSKAGDSKTAIRKAGDTYSGTLLAGWGNELYEADGRTLKKDSKNPDAALRNQPLLNMVILSGFRYEKGRYTGGKLYDPRLGKTFPCYMQLKDDRLEMRIYWGIPLLGTTKKWTRIAE